MGDIGLKPVVVYHNLRWGRSAHSMAGTARAAWHAQRSAAWVGRLAGKPGTAQRLQHACTAACSPRACAAVPQPAQPSRPRFAAPSSPHARLLFCAAPLPSGSVPELYEHALKYEPSTHIVGSGALATLSGAKTGRSPKCARCRRRSSSGCRRGGRCCGRPAWLPTLSMAQRNWPSPHAPPPPLPPMSRDKRVVREPGSEADIWWGAGSPNYEMDER